jgi:hypothetical protein
MYLAIKKMQQVSSATFVYGASSTQSCRPATVAASRVPAADAPFAVNFPAGHFLMPGMQSDDTTFARPFCSPMGLARLRMQK